MIAYPKLGMLVSLYRRDLPQPLRQPWGRIVTIVKKSGSGLNRGDLLVKTYDGRTALVHRSRVYEYKEQTGATSS